MIALVNRNVMLQHTQASHMQIWVTYVVGDKIITTSIDAQLQEVV